MHCSHCAQMAEPQWKRLKNSLFRQAFILCSPSWTRNDCQPLYEGRSPISSNYRALGQQPNGIGHSPDLAAWLLALSGRATSSRFPRKEHTGESQGLGFLRNSAVRSGCS